MKWVWSGSVHQGWALWGRKVSRNTWNTELRFWLSLAHAPAIQVGAPTSLHPPFPAFFFLQVPQPPLTLLPSPRLSVSNITSDLLSIQYVFFSVCLPPSLKIWLSQTPFQSLHYPSIFFFALDTLQDISQHPFCPAHPLLFIPSSQLPKYLILLYLIPKEPINSEHPAFSCVHSLLFSNTTPYFK